MSRGFDYRRALEVVRPELVRLYTGAPGRMAWPATLFDELGDEEDSAQEHDEQTTAATAADRSTT